MSDASQGPGWWQASDGRWYPPESAPGAAAPPPPGFGPPQAAATKKGMPGCARWGLIALAVFVALGVGCTALLSDAADEASRDGADSDTDEVTGVTPTDETTTTQAPVAEGPEPTCAYIGPDPNFGAQVELTFTNTLGDVNDVEVTYALLDGEGGTRFFTGTAGGLDLEDIHFPRAKEQFRLSVLTGEDLPPNVEETTIGCTVLAIEEGTEIGGYQRATDADTCEVVGADSSGNIQVDVAATSPYDETTTVQTWWALQAPGPVRFETETEVVDLVGAGESFRISPEHGTEKPGWIGDGEVTCVVLGFWDQGR